MVDLIDIDCSTSAGLAFVRLARCGGIGPVQFSKILSEYGTPEDALCALEACQNTRGHYKITFIPTWEDIQKEATKLHKMGGFFIGLAPPIGFNMKDGPPALLAGIGNKKLLKRNSVAIVGSRAATLSGLTLANTFASELSQAGFVIVSGLARGVDTRAHQASLLGGTIAVVANGLDRTYPPENHTLQCAIAQKGLLLSEMPLGCHPSRLFFPRRNRIISYLTMGTVVIEAHKKSGSLITARFAKMQGRKVWAVPGSPLDPLASGPNQLLKEGALLAESVHDVLHDLGQKAPLPTQAKASTSTHPFLHLLSRTVPTSVEQLAQESQLSPDVVRQLLLELELEDKVTQKLQGVFLK